MNYLLPKSPRSINPFVAIWIYSLVLFVALCVVITIPGCKKKEAEPDIPVDQYIQPDTPPTYTTHDSEVKASVKFKDVTAEAGIRFTHQTGAFGNKWMPETMGGGGAFMDFDGDDRPDILLINSSYWPGHELSDERPSHRLFVNRSQNGQIRFEDFTQRSGLEKIDCYGMGAAVADYDGDGDQDVYITAVGKNRLLRNDDGKFTDITDQAGVGFSQHDESLAPWEWSTGAVWIDYDRDGDLDLFVANYVQWTPDTDIWTTLDGKNKTYATPQAYQGSSCTLFRNEGGDRFVDVTQKAGVLNREGKSLSVIADDFNDDGWVDLVITNDTQPNFLYVNNQDGTFTDIALLAGIAYDENGLARAGMGVGVTDVKNQGLRSIAIGNFSGEPLSLYTQTLSDVFVDQAGVTRLTRPTQTSLTFGVLFADFNLDGFEDLILANGHIEPDIATIRDGWTFAQSPQLFLNNRSGKFIDFSEKAGADFSIPMVGRVAATADIDNDGDLDLLLTANGGSPRLLRNDSAHNSRAVRIKLIGVGKNINAVGSSLKADFQGQIQSRFITTGGSYLSQSELIATFGVADTNSIEKLRVRWSDGSQEEFSHLSAGATYHIRQGKGVVRSVPFRR